MLTDSLNCELVLKTQPVNCDAPKYLATFLVEVPAYIWTELLTHKRFARNAASNRAMGIRRNINLGGYVPPVFYGRGSGMSAGAAIPLQEEARKIYERVWNQTMAAAKLLDDLGVSKEQSSRVLPTFKIMRGLITGTFDAWVSFLELRNHPTADTAMQLLASIIRELLYDSKAVISNKHLPFLNEADENLPSQDLCLILAARIARLSYGEIRSKDDDIILGRRLLADQHLSPFEHLAVWEHTPFKSALCSVPNDEHNCFGWSNARSILEKGKIRDYILS